MLVCAAMSDELLSCVEIEPEATAQRSVIWLHGLGADGHDFESIVPHLGIDPQLAVRFVFPHAPHRSVTINMGMQMPAWYDIRELSLRRDVDMDGVAESAQQVRSLIEREKRRGIATSRIVLAGFSQGGAIALHVGLRLEEQLAGILALSTYLICDDVLEQQRASANVSTPILQAHGSTDPMVPLEAGEISRDRLLELGYDVDWRTYPMGHEVSPLEIRDVGEFLGRVLAD